MKSGPSVDNQQWVSTKVLSKFHLARREGDMQQISKCNDSQAITVHNKCNRKVTNTHVPSNIPPMTSPSRWLTTSYDRTITCPMPRTRPFEWINYSAEFVRYTHTHDTVRWQHRHSRHPAMASPQLVDHNPRVLTTLGLHPSLSNHLGMTSGTIRIPPCRHAWFEGRYGLFHLYTNVGMLS
jgi:hypothetical protein